MFIVHGLYNCVGVSVSVPENVPGSAFIYMILARDPDPGQEVEVRVFCHLFIFFPTLI